MDNITVKFILQEIDCLVSCKVEVDSDRDSISVIKLLNDLTEKLRAAGAYSLKTNQPGKSYAHKMTGSDGTHPDDLLPALEQSGKEKLCPKCGEKLGIAVIIAGPKAKNPGTKYGKYVHAAKTTCGWDKDKEQPQWVPKLVLEELLNRSR